MDTLEAEYIGSLIASMVRNGEHCARTAENSAPRLTGISVC